MYTRKSLILTIALVLITLTSSYSQGFKLGLTATPTFNWFSPSVQTVTKDATRTGFNYGLMFDYFFAENYAVHLGIMHSFTGGALTINDTAVNTPSFVHKLQQLEIPFAIKLTTKELGYMKFYGQMGINLGVTLAGKGDVEFMTNDSLHVDMENVNLLDKNNVLATDDYQAALFSFGLHIGAGIHYETPAGVVLAGAYFNNGFLNVNREGDYKATPKTIGIRLGFMF